MGGRKDSDIEYGGKRMETKEGIESINHYHLSLDALYISVPPPTRKRAHTQLQKYILVKPMFFFLSSHLRLSPPFSLFLVHVYKHREFQYTVWNANTVDTARYVLDKDKERYKAITIL